MRFTRSGPASGLLIILGHEAKTACSFTSLDLSASPQTERLNCPDELESAVFTGDITLSIVTVI